MYYTTYDSSPSFHREETGDNTSHVWQEVVQLPFQTVVFESIEGKGDILMENVNTQI